jgi:hypothetical protein
MAKTQHEKILDYLRDKGELSQREAYFMGIGRLASRIHDLKKAGYMIITEMREVTNADGSKSTVAFYHLLGGDEQ